MEQRQQAPGPKLSCRRKNVMHLIKNIAFHFENPPIVIK